jgi:hypothetical protein
MFNLYNKLFKNNNNNKLDNNVIILNKNFENNECIICLEPMIVNNKVKILRCGHIYHYDCINQWIEKKGEINCPLCSK